MKDLRTKLLKEVDELDEKLSIDTNDLVYKILLAKKQSLLIEIEKMDKAYSKTT